MWLQYFLTFCNHHTFLQPVFFIKEKWALRGLFWRTHFFNFYMLGVWRQNSWHYLFPFLGQTPVRTPNSQIQSQQYQLNYHCYILILQWLMEPLFWKYIKLIYCKYVSESDFKLKLNSFVISIFISCLD